jgi:putative (di)nucleoside polyphosphate hydrolase
MLHYRSNVALILTRADGLVLLCERVSFDGSWQFPQGGAKAGEDSAAALAREVEEEISLGPKDYTIISQKGPYRYEFRRGFRKEGFDGQEQTYFLAEIESAALGKIRVDQEEFQSFRWLAPKDFRVEWVPPIKREVYRAVFRDFFGVSID